MRRYAFLVFFLGFLTFPLLAEEAPILIIDPHGHSSTITDLMFTPDGQTLISVSFDKTIRFWDVETGDLIKTLRGHIGEGYEGALMAAALSPDGKILAVGGFLGPQGGDPELTGHIRLFDVHSGEQIGVLAGHENVIFGLDFSPDGQWLASASGDRLTAIWDIAPILAHPGSEANLVALFGNNSTLGPPSYDVSFSPNKRVFVAADYWRTITLRELRTNPSGIMGPDVLQASYEMEKHRDQVRCVEYAPSGEYIVSGGKDGILALWDGTGKSIAQLERFDQPIGTISFSQDSRKIVVSGYSGRDTHVYAIPSGERLTTFPHHTNTVEASAFYGSNLIATAGGNHNDIYVWDADSGEIQTHISTRGRDVLSLAFDEQLNLAFGQTDLSPSDFEGKVPQNHPEFTPLEHRFALTEVRFSHTLPETLVFSRIQTGFQNFSLELLDNDVLRMTGGGTISNDPNSDGLIRAYTFTPEGTVVVGSSYSLKLYQTDGRLHQTFRGHTGEVLAVAVSHDGRILASGSSDQTMKFWNLKTGECLATLFVAVDTEWVCWTPQGYYAASAGGEKYIGWQINQGRDRAARYYPVSVFRDQFYRPELVKRTLEVGSFEQAFQEFQARSEQPLESTLVTQILPPVVQWTTPGPEPVEIEQSTFHLQANIESDSPLRLVKVMINGRPADDSEATGRGLGIGTSEPDNVSTIDREISLLPGRNIITIFAANDNAGSTSDSRTIIYRSEEELPDLYAVVVGISEYMEHGLQLTYADDDALAISRLVQGQEGKLYRNIHLRKLYDSDATREHILDALTWLQENAAQHDVALFFVAAHGTNEAGKYYLLPADVDPDEIESTSVSWQTFSDALGGLPAKILVLLDTCHSGQLGQDMPITPRQTDNTEALRTLSSDEYGVVILAASTGSESSLEQDEWGHGAFTKALLEALEEGLADYSSDNIIHLRELDLYLADRVEELTAGAQHPTTQKPSTISRFPVVRTE